MNSPYIVLLICILFFCYSDVHGRYIKSQNIKLVNETQPKNISEISLKKKPKVPKPCKGCLGGDDDDGDDDDDDESDLSECFPANALVTLHSGQKVRLDNLRVGDKVKNLNDKGSTVFGFSHSDRNIKAEFIRLITNNGNLTVTRGHYVFASRQYPHSTSNSNLLLASDIKKGDLLFSEGNNGLSEVLDTTMVTETGLFNPHSMSGELIVDGFRVSSFTKAVNPAMASGILAPLRAVFQFSKLDLFSSAFSNGCPPSLYYVCKRVSMF